MEKRFAFQEVDRSEVLELINAGREVYRLYDDGTEALVECDTDIDADGVYGVEYGWIVNYHSMIQNSGGFSLDSQNNAPHSGYMVSVYGAERVIENYSSLDEARVNQECDSYRAANPSHYFGAWLDGDKLYLDNSVNIADIEVAIAFGRANKQLAIYDVNNGESIYLD
jgi:hypothetical protein